MAQKLLKGRSGRALGLAAVAMLAAGILSFEGYDARMIAYVVSMAVALLVIGAYLQFRGKEEEMVDERTKKISRASMSHSWWYTYILLAILMLVEEFGLAKLTVSGVLGLTFFFMVASQFMLNWHFAGRGDAE